MIAVKMYPKGIVIFVCFSFLVIFNTGKVICDEEDDFKQLMKLLHKEVKPERTQKQKFGILSHQVKSFSWDNCGSGGDLATINSLSLSPDPLNIPGNVTVAMSGSLSTPVQSPVSVELEIQKKVVFWITVPCIDNVGSCSYQDICSMLSNFPCPPAFKTYGIPCSCPVKAGTYKLPPTPIYVDPSGIPSWAESGDYKMKAKASYNGKEIFCLAIELSLA